MHCIDEQIIKISPFWTLLFQNLSDCLVFPFSNFAIYGNIFLLKYSGYFAWDLHTLLDGGNLCHSDVWYILCCLLRVFVSTVTWDFRTLYWQVSLFAIFTAISVWFLHLYVAPFSQLLYFASFQCFWPVLPSFSLCVVLDSRDLFCI